MGEVDYRQHAEDERQPNGEQGVNRPQRNAGDELQPEQLGCEFNHDQARPSRSRDQPLCPSSLQDRKFDSLGASILATEKTSFLSFIPLDLDSTMMIDCTDWWSHLR